MSNKFIQPIIGVVMLAILLRIDYIVEALRFENEILEQRVTQIEGTVYDAPGLTKYTKKDVDCLTRNIYYEAGVEPTEGKLAVAVVTINRLTTGRWGNSICSVVHAPSQFSWTKKAALPTPDPALYTECERVANLALNGRKLRGADRSLYYHATYIKKPHWADLQYKTLQIGQHVFYTRARGNSPEM